MTQPATQQRIVLIVGGSQRVLDDTVATLGDHGYIAHATNDIDGDVSDLVDLTAVDLAVLGTRMSGERRTEVREQITAVNPRAMFIDGLGGIPGLIASQVDEAFTVGHRDPAPAPAYEPDDHTIRLTLTDLAAVTVTVWWRTSIIPPNPESDSLVLLDGPLPRGKHTIPVPDHVFLPPKRLPDSPNPSQAVFASVRVDAAIYNFGIATGQ
ncbi:MAG: hypothetical protein ACRDQA_27890 [Nocardioidaceae bacterium]